MAARSTQHTAGKQHTRSGIDPGLGLKQLLAVLGPIAAVRLAAENRSAATRYTANEHGDLNYLRPVRLRNPQEFSGNLVARQTVPALEILH